VSRPLQGLHMSFGALTKIKNLINITRLTSAI